MQKTEMPEIAACCDNKRIRTVNEMDANLVFAIMGTLNYRQRAVLSLRYFDKMSFSTISTIVDSSYLYVVFCLFFIRYSLRKRLVAIGLESGSLDSFIDLFGKLTMFTETAKKPDFVIYKK